MGVIIIIFSVVRVIVVGSDGMRPEPTWLATWSAIEASVAVIVACLSSFKAILTSRSRNKTGSSSNNRAYHKAGHGTDARSERDREEYRAKSNIDSEEEHELHRYPGGRSMSNVAAGSEKKIAVSEESIELPEPRQASFESQARILRRVQ